MARSVAVVVQVMIAGTKCVADELASSMRPDERRLSLAS